MIMILHNSFQATPSTEESDFFACAHLLPRPLKLMREFLSMHHNNSMDVHFSVTDEDHINWWLLFPRQDITVEVSWQIKVVQI